MAVEDLRQSPMMAHMLDALENGEDIGHYGRLVFAMIGRHFVDNDELVGLLTQDHDAGEQEIKAGQDPGVPAAAGLPDLPEPGRPGRLQPLPGAPVPGRSLRVHSGVQGGESLRDVRP
jgi:hypothetical protein